MSSPTDRPKAIASLVAASAVADRKLLASFSACAMPGRSPTRRRTVAQPRQHRLDGRARGVGPGVPSPTACGRGPRPRRPTPGRRRRPRRRRPAAPRSTGRPPPRPSTCRRRAPSAGRRRRRSRRATARTPTPSGRLSTTTSARAGDGGDVRRRTSRPRGALGSGHVVGRARRDPARRGWRRGRAPMFPRPTTPTTSGRHVGMPRRPRPARTAGSARFAATPGRRAAVGGDLEQQLVELVVGDARAHGRRRRGAGTPPSARARRSSPAPAGSGRGPTGRPPASTPPTPST